MKNVGKTRSSNIELFRIITMLSIVAHHYVVNSDLIDVIYANPTSLRSMFLLIFGAWGKTGINCFVLITGYFMCKSNITIRKYMKLLFEVLFYNIVIYFIFLMSGYISFSLTDFAKSILPVSGIKQDFTSCFLVFYLCIPFLNILVNNMNEKMHRYLLCLLLFVYVFFGTVKVMAVEFNYVEWFVTVYLIAAYIRLYPKEIYSKTKLWGVVTLVAVGVSILSVYMCAHIDYFTNKRWIYAFVADSNTLFAIVVGVSSFLFFKNLPVKNSKVINQIAASTFGVLLIHANSDAMRKWLWQDVLHNVDFYNSEWMIVHAFASVLIVFIVCVVIDSIRIHTVEAFVFRKLDKVLEAKR